MNNALNFLNAKGEMADLIRSHNWSNTSLGPPENWPQSLKAKLNTLTYSAFPMFLFWGKDLICFYNDAFRPSFGVEGKHPALGKKASEVWPEIWDFIEPLTTGVMTTGNSAWFEDRHIPYYRNGKIEDIYWTFSCSAVTDDQSQIAGVLVICTETTDKVHLLKQLQESNDRYSFAIEASELGTWDLDPRTNMFRANARLLEWFGLEASEEASLETALNLISEADRQRVTDAIRIALQYSSGGSYDIEHGITNVKTGQERIVRAKGKAAFDSDHNAYRFNGTLQDITVEVKAREQNQKFSLLVENSVDLMAILKLDGKNSYINKAGKELLGVPEDADVTQIPISDFHTPEQLDFVMSQIIPSVMSTGKWSGQFAIRNTQTGEIIPLYNNCHRIDDERTGEPIGVGTVMRDMRNELNARQKLEEEVKRRTKELVKLNEELERKNKDLASFAFISSHDLQEPLRKINTFISRIEENDSSIEKNELYFNKIKSSAKRMQTLINDLLAFSRTNADDIQLEDCDLAAIVRDVQNEFHEKLEKAGAQVQYGGLPQIRASAFQINQLFSNLFSNSIKFAKPDQPLYINIHSEVVDEELPAGASRPSRFYKISFSDNGIGFDPRYASRIFEVFQRLHSRDVYEGTGIGLSICKKIMENHNGLIRAHGKEGEGAVFYLYFPA